MAVCGKTAWMASLKPVKPSMQATKMSSTPCACKSLTTLSQKLAPFTAVAQPVTQHIALPLQSYAQHDVHRRVDPFLVAPQLEMQCIQVDDGINRCQHAVLPGLDQRPNLIEVFQRGLDVAGGKPL